MQQGALLHVFYGRREGLRTAPADLYPIPARCLEEVIQPISCAVVRLTVWAGSYPPETALRMSGRQYDLSGITIATSGIRACKYQPGRLPC